MDPASVPAFNDNNSSDLPKFTMQRNHNPHDETIAPTKIEEGLLGSIFSACEDEFPNHHYCSVQHEHVYCNDHGDMECLISAMWENWLKIPSEPQTLDNVVFGVPSSACIYTSSRPALETSLIQPLSLLSADASPYAANEYSLNENNHVNEHLDTSYMGSLMAPYPPPLMVPVSPSPRDLMAPVSPPLPELKARAGQSLKARASSHKKSKTAGNFRNNGARKNEEAHTILVESIEDGYVWHKYGQKIIKNRMHPRSYFKCANPDCPVKKRTENSSDKQGSVLITYNCDEHNHLPPSKNPFPTA